MANEEFIWIWLFVNIIFKYFCVGNEERWKTQQSNKPTLILRQELGKALSNDCRSVVCQHYFQTVPLQHTKIAKRCTGTINFKCTRNVLNINWYLLDPKFQIIWNKWTLLVYVLFWWNILEPLIVDSRAYKRPEERNHLGDLGVNGRIKLKCKFNKWGGVGWTVLAWLNRGRWWALWIR